MFLNLATESIGSPTPQTNLYWKWWIQFCQSTNLDPWMRSCQTQNFQDSSSREQHFLAFAAAVRHSVFHSGKQVNSQTVERALRQAAEILTQHGCPDPRRRIPGSKELSPAFQKLFREYKTNNPSVIGKLPLPDDVLTFIYNCPASLHAHFSLPLLHTLRDTISREINSKRAR